jgi:integrase
MTPDRRAMREHSVLAGLERFCTSEGLGPAVLVKEVIEAYLVLGLEGRAPSTKGTYHSVLRNMTEARTPKGTPRFPGSLAPPPYGAAERAELYATALAQRRPWRVHSALALLALGLGAGLRPGELVSAIGHDVTARGTDVVLSVRGRRPRLVPIKGHEAALVVGLAAEPCAHLFHPEGAERSYPNFVNDFCRGLVADPSAPKFSASRARSSYICDHLSSGTALSVLLDVTGIAEVESLLRYSLHVAGAPGSKGALRRLAATERP